MTTNAKRDSAEERDSLRSRWRALLRLVSFLWRLNPRGMFWTTALLLLGGLLPVVLLEVLRRFIDRALDVIAGAAPTTTPLVWFGLLVVILLVEQLINATNRWLALLLNEEFKERAQEELLSKAGRLPLAAYEEHQLYDLLQRARQGIDRHLFAVANNLPATLVSLITAVSLLLYVGAAHISFPIIFVVAVIPLMIFDARYGRKRWAVERKQTHDERLQLYLDDLITQRRAAGEIRLFGLQQHFLDEWHALFTRLQRERLALARRAALTGLSGQVHIPLTMLLITSTVTIWVLRGSMTVGAFATYISAVARFTTALWRLVSSATRLNTDLRYIKDLFEYLDLADDAAAAPAQRDSAASSAVHPLLSATPTITFHDVSFTYPGARQPALAHIDLTLRPNERIALVGENGAGKSTIAKLLLGLYQPSSGYISVDGVRLDTIDPAVWRSYVAAVFQDYMQYALSARQNIGFGRLQQLDDLNAIQAAAAKSGADDVIAGLPAGYETLLGKAFDEAGRDLSTGQWQKLAVARAYLRDAPIVVLDEPTAALDARAEVEVYRQFRDMAVGKSVLLISHRLGSARLADRIVVLEQGQIMEQGSHADLMARGGRYAEMYAAQAQWYQDDRQTPRHVDLLPQGG
ncbi:MAG TPA: ABC transporter ATP-binding protein [Herpetosiphonaceae bacterium]